MSFYDTNIFKIENLDKLKAQYRLYEIIGLSETSEEYDSNIQYIIKTLSYQLGQPITVISKTQPVGQKLFLVVKNDSAVLDKIPEEFMVKKRDSIFFRSTDQVFELDFLNYDESTKEICRRFLQFDLNSEIQRHKDLWQPRAGQPFFSRKAIDGNHQVTVYNGFLPRVVELPGGGWGISIELTNKYVETTPLPNYITRDEFNQLKDSHFIYHYGRQWYEVHPQEWSDLNAANYKFRRETGGELMTVIGDLHRQSGNSMPPEVARLPDDVALLMYSNNRNEERRIPAGLCYRVLDTDDPLVGKLHELSIIPPFLRRRKAFVVRRNYLNRLRNGGVELEIAQTPIRVKKDVFDFPDQEFGNGSILSVTGKSGIIPVAMTEVGRTRKQLLRSPEGGCFVNRPFERQYFVLPESIANSFGRTQLLKHLQQEVDRMHPTRSGWKPEIITYNDRNNKNSLQLGFEIIEQLQKSINQRTGGYALIMIPTVGRKKRVQDDLATLCIVEGQKMFNLEVSIMHTDILSECYDYKPQSGYFIRQDKKGLYFGYIQGVALNKVILNNERWPFILKTLLSADLYIGIDVKHSLAGFTFITQFAKTIKPVREETKRKEQLSTLQIKTVLIKQIRKLAEYQDFHSIVIHRDGRLFRPELDGIKQAIEDLKSTGHLPSDVTFTVVELPKQSTTTFRIFEELSPYDVLKTETENRLLLNPQVGSWVPFNEREGFVCTTGREFKHKGTSLPLYVKVAHGNMPLQVVLQDIYYLSTLAYAKPDDCSRDPLTIKMTDRRINEFGGKYDNENFNLLKELNLDEA
ncbi:argonaute/piwi family protein [Spirosoma gilvum]